MVKVGIVGCGAIGETVARRIDAGIAGLSLCSVHDLDRDKAERLRRSLERKPDLYSLADLAARCDVAVEATSAKAAPAVIDTLLEGGAPVVVLTVGALITEPRLIQKANKLDRRVYVPSGAVAGLDWVQAAAVGRLDKITLTTRKAPRSLLGAPGFDELTKDGAIQGERLLFVGSVAEAVAKFPANINVAALLALAAGADHDAESAQDLSKIQVRVVADPTVDQNVHEIEAAGEVGRLKVRIENNPSPLNPRSSLVAAFSTVATLKKIAARVSAGT